MAAADEMNAPVVQPWRRVTLDREYAGARIVAGDLDGDGSVGIVSARMSRALQCSLPRRFDSRGRNLEEGTTRREVARLFAEP
jgi:hypothetical protein